MSQNPLNGKATIPHVVKTKIMKQQLIEIVYVCFIASTLLNEGRRRKETAATIVYTHQPCSDTTTMITT